MIRVAVVTLLVALLTSLGVSTQGGASAAPRRNGDLISPDATWQVVKTTGGVGLFGDSIMARGTGYALAQMINSHGHNVAIDAVNGRTTATMATAIEDYAARGLTPPRLVVISGANDTYTPNTFEPALSRVMTVAAGRPVYWLSVYVDHWALDGNRRARDLQGSGVVNAALWRATQRFPNLTVVDWNGFLWGVPGSISPACCPGVLTYPRPVDRLLDGVHPDAEGVAAIVVLVEQKMYPTRR